MKKVKIMLMSAVVVAAVGGAIAFKAQSASTLLNCGDSPTSCPNQIFATTVGANESNFNAYCTPQGTTVCTYAIKEQ